MESTRASRLKRRAESNGARMLESKKKKELEDNDLGSSRRLKKCSSQVKTYPKRSTRSAAISQSSPRQIRTTSRNERKLGDTHIASSTVKVVKRSNKSRKLSASSHDSQEEGSHVLAKSSPATRSSQVTRLSQITKISDCDRKHNATISCSSPVNGLHMKCVNKRKSNIRYATKNIASTRKDNKSESEDDLVAENGIGSSEDDEEEGIHDDASDVESGSSNDEDQSSSSEIQFANSSHKSRSIKFTSSIVELETALQQSENILKQAKKMYERKLNLKEEEIKRLKNELQWKEEQLNDMNELASKNMELESKMNQVLGDKKAYEAEVQRVEDEKVNKTEQKNNKSKKKKTKDESEDAPKKKKTRRRSKRGASRKKGEESNGEDIDALFVSEDDDEVPDTDDKNVSNTNVTDTDEVKTVISPPSLNKTVPVKALSPPLSSEKKDIAVSSEEVREEQPNKSEDNDGDKKDKLGRHTIRKVITGKKLNEQTVKAAKTEKERRERARQEHDKHEVVTTSDPKTKLEICTKLVLAFKERKASDKKNSKTPLVEVNPRLVKKLKPHQCDAVEFMWDNIVESMDKLKNGEDPGQGCILAHCMGLGKTLSVITLVHTLLSNEHTEQFTSCLVVCPLNTILNWQYEWQKWLDKRDRVPVFEMASCKNNADRAKLLQKWTSNGGIMIMGYQLFRILANYPGKSHKNKKAFDSCLLDPGPDIVICDEGHVLKNDGSAISKAMNRIRTRRRIILTGTPLQNNLVEYHCMMNFVKPSLLGTLKEFKNRFANPISNGQHSDSTALDVRLMKRRAHILHEMLLGCVQRKDYTELTKLLPPKHEYVISVRLAPLQVDLYEKYLSMNRSDSNGFGAGASLFSDYQALMRIWTHPWVLKLEEMRQEKKAFEFQDDELDELDESDIVISSDSNEDESQHDTVDTSQEEEQAAESKDKMSNGDFPQKKRKTRRAVIDESDENSDTEEQHPPPKRKTRSQKLAVSSENRDEEQSCSNKRGSNSRVNNDDSAASSVTEEDGTASEDSNKAMVLAGEVIRKWKSSSRHGGNEVLKIEDLHRKEEFWWTKYIDEEQHEKQVELSGKLVVLFEIVRMAETLGDKVLVFSQSLLSLDLIELFLKYKDEEAEQLSPKKGEKVNRWKKDEDYLRMDGSTGALTRNKFTNTFNDAKNARLRLFLISTRAGGLGINLDSANRVIIFDASWNPSHDVQSIFRVYRFGQIKPVYVYRLLAQGTMEEKIYDRQVAKETLSQRVIDEHQIDRHFTLLDLRELYLFKPDRLNDPNAPKRPTPAVPKDVVLAELLTSSQKQWIVKYHEHDSLLENRPEEDLNEEERAKAWEEYEKEKEGLYTYSRYNTNNVITQQYISQQTLNQMHNRSLHGGINPYLSVSQLARPQTIAPQYPRIITLPRPIQSAANQSNPQQPKSNPYENMPKVVQEILKYNPTISTLDLQKRLQAFLGMQSKYQAQQVINGPSASQQPQPQPGSSSDQDQANKPSRLPQPGNVPANKQS